MYNIDSIQKLIDEMAVFSVLVQELSEPYKTTISKKSKVLNAHLSEILTIETEKYNAELQNYASDLLAELEAQQYEENK